MKDQAKERVIITGFRIKGNWDWFDSVRCIVCNLYIKREDINKSRKCPHCNGIGHRNHILEWLRMKGTCPHCRAKLRSNELKEVK